MHIYNHVHFMPKCMSYHEAIGRLVITERDIVSVFDYIYYYIYYIYYIYIYNIIYIYIYVYIYNL